MHILIIDNDEQFCATLQRFLSSRGHQVTSVHSGEQALELIRHTGFDTVISDIHLSGMSGLDFLRLSQTSHALLPVIITTGDRDLDNAVTAFRYGAVDYFKKPIDLLDLLRCLKRFELAHYQNIKGR